jgi:nitrogen fixation protein FixH
MTTQLSDPNLGAALLPRSTALAPPRFQAARLWPWVPALLLVSLIGTQLTVLASVLDDPTFATEGDYYRKAVDWDAHMARQRQSQALGWTARVRTGEPEAAGRAVAVTLVDARGEAVRGARAHGIAFPNTRAAQPRELIFEEAAPGVYRVLMPAERAGLWELRLSAARGSDAYEATLRFELSTGERAQ